MLIFNTTTCLIQNTGDKKEKIKRQLTVSEEIFLNFKYGMIMIYVASFGYAYRWVRGARGTDQHWLRRAARSEQRAKTWESRDNRRVNRQNTDCLCFVTKLKINTKKKKYFLERVLHWLMFQSNLISVSKYCFVTC